MPAPTRNQAQQLTLRQREGRAANAVAELLRQKLSVPHIYIEPRSSLLRADVLAVDRAGSGDLHAVEIKLPKDFGLQAPVPKVSYARNLNKMSFGWYPQFRKQMHEVHRQLMSLPAHYRYLAIPIPQVSFELVMGELGPVLYSPDGIGRLGIVRIIDRGEEPPLAELAITPERFRVDPMKLRNIEKKLLEKVRPDIEVRI
ncbi:MAG: hypothetical protein ABSD98_09580 [Candidatus Korobacteraceae bacterium]|jgi:hypothetical protein